MVKKILIALICLSAYCSYAQNGTISPYSYFGLGDLKAGSTVENQMMGGLLTYADSIHVNLRNPAAYGGLRLTTYTAGLSRKELRFKTYTDQQRSAVTSLDYLSIGFPIAKNAGLGFGVMPYSSVGYGLQSESVDQDQNTVVNTYSGEGGVNKVYMSLGYKFLKDVSVGATVNYNFGEITTNRVQTTEDVQLGTFDRKNSRITGFDFNFGLNYTPKIKDKYTLHTSVAVNTQANLVSKNTQSIGSVNTSTGRQREVIDVDLDATYMGGTMYKVPTTTTLGVGFGQDRKWFLGAEYSFQELSAFENVFMGANNVSYNDGSTIAFGGFFIPDYASITSFFNKVTYRAGLRYEKTGMVVSEKDINNFGITFGLGIPLGARTGSFSNLNLGFELGRRGTSANDLVEESYLKVNLGLSLNDKWFRKRKIN